MMPKSWGRFRTCAFVLLGVWAGFAAAQTETPTATSTPLVLPFNPDLDDNGVVNAIDLLSYIRAWQATDFVEPTPTPVSYILTGIVRSSGNVGIPGGRVVAGTAMQLSDAIGFYQLPSVSSSITTLLVYKEGYQDAEIPITPSFPVTTVYPILYSVGEPTFTPTPTSTQSRTVTPTASATSTPQPTPTRTPTATGSLLPTPTRTPTPSRTLTPTRTGTPTRTPTPTVTPTPTQIPLLGSWVGKINPNGGVIYNNTTLNWTVAGATQATARILSRDLSGLYHLSIGNAVVFDGTGADGSALYLEMLWNGSDLLEGTFDLFIPGIGQEQGPVFLNRSNP